MPEFLPYNEVKLLLKKTISALYKRKIKISDNTGPLEVFQLLTTIEYASWI
jgi:hypothetical protein